MSKLFECEICGKETDKLMECDLCGRLYCPDCGGKGFLCDECLERQEEHKSIWERGYD